MIATWVRWYLRSALSLRDVEELTEMGLPVDHTTILAVDLGLCCGSVATIVRAV
jgi:hypothetical protein